MHELNSGDQLEHELTDMLRFQGATAETNGFVEVAIRAKLEDKVEMVLTLEGVKQVDDVRVGVESAMNGEFLGTFVNGEGRWAGIGICVLGQALDSNILPSLVVLSHEDQAEGTVVESGERLEASVQEYAIFELIAHTLHFQILGSKLVEPTR